MNATWLCHNAQLSLAAYASLNTDSLNSQKTALKKADFTDSQANAIASTYDVFAQYNDGITSFSATLFRNEIGDVTLAIRGTLERIGTPNDLTTDLDIFSSGAGYDQIVAMANWWQKVLPLKRQFVRSACDQMPGNHCLAYFGFGS